MDVDLASGVPFWYQWRISSTVVAEKTPFGSRAVLVLSALGQGGFASSVVNTILIAAFKGSIEANVEYLDRALSAGSSSSHGGALSA
ncbi:hypothetical protein EHS25_007001 [Saitozyma podzolica]|uniref:Uncharacterized protein n=1 Tax=Saitozyma podzolica TaxID=1890683 RepID=A0A427XPR9_9TREE|nr:hypothetical protein EHS25_007001 [Saitozyma podzolica]